MNDRVLELVLVEREQQIARLEADAAHGHGGFHDVDPLDLVCKRQITTIGRFDRVVAFDQDPSWCSAGITRLVNHCLERVVFVEGQVFFLVVRIMVQNQKRIDHHPRSHGGKNTGQQIATTDNPKNVAY